MSGFENMKILLLIDSLGCGGAQRQLSNLAVELKNNGHNIKFVRYWDDNFYLPLLEKAGISPILVNEKNLFRRAYKIRKLLRSEKPDVVISFLDAPNFYASLASFGSHSWKLIIGERNCDIAGFTSRSGKIIRSIMAKKADIISCNSQSAANLWAQFYPKTKEKLLTIYNIVEPPKGRGEPSADGKIRFVVAARKEKEKNLIGVINAIASLSDDEKEVLELHWYGRAVQGQDLLAQATELIRHFSLEKCIFLHEPTDRIHDEMAKSDFVSLFSFREGLPNAVLEGMALKKPIVMSKVSDYAVLVNEENGFLCDPADTADIAAAIRAALATTPEQRTEMGEKSYEKLLSICSKDVIVRKWLDLIES